MSDQLSLDYNYIYLLIEVSVKVNTKLLEKTIAQVLCFI